MFPAKPSTASGGERSQRGPSAIAQKIGNANRLWRPKLWIVPEQEQSAHDRGRERRPGPVARAEPPEDDEQWQDERGAGAVDEALEALASRRGAAGRRRRRRRPPSARGRSAARRRRWRLTATTARSRSRGRGARARRGGGRPSRRGRRGPLAAPLPLGVEEDRRVVAAFPEVALDAAAAATGSGRAEPAARALAAGEPRERERDQDAVRAGDRGDRAERRLPRAAGRAGRSAAAHAAAASARASG